jgi:hypothetical protein
MVLPIKGVKLVLFGSLRNDCLELGLDVFPLDAKYLVVWIK